MTLRSRVTVAAGVAVAVAIAVASLAAWLVVPPRCPARSTMPSSHRRPPWRTGRARRRARRSDPSDDTSDLFTDSYLQLLDGDGDVVSSFGDRELPVGAEEQAVASGAAS